MWNGRQHALAPRDGVCTWRDGRSTHRSRRGQVTRKSLSSRQKYSVTANVCMCHTQLNLDEQMAEQLEGVGGAEQRRARAYVIDRCGPPT